MSDLQEVRENFKRIQKSFSQTFPKVDPQLLIDLLLKEQGSERCTHLHIRSFHEKRNKHRKSERHNFERTGTIPSIHDGGTHKVATHKVTLDLLKFISENEDVLEITGDYSGGAASIGARHEHRH